jgi:hypothetical protein
MNPGFRCAASGLFAAFVLVACATQEYVAAPVAAPGDGPREEQALVVTGIEDVELSSTYFGFIKFSFVNKSSQWLRIERVGLEFGHEELDANVYVPAGIDLRDWARAAESRLARQRANEAVVASSLAMLGAAAMLSGSRSGVVGGGALAIGSATYLGVRELSKNVTDANRPELFPSEHVLGGAFSVPPGMSVQKWVLLYTAEPMRLPFISTLLVSIAEPGGAEQQFKLQFRNPLVGSPWQSVYRQGR